MKKKSILLIIPVHFELYKDVIQSLKNIDFEVIILFVTDKPFVYRGILDRLNSFVHKNILAEKNFKKSLIFNRENEDLVFQLDSLSEILDYALIIRPDLLALDTLLKIKNKVGKMVAYQWDGLNRFPSVFERIKVFDKFYVFDHTDYLKYKNEFSNIDFITNFYLEIPSDNDVVVYPKSICFVGSYLEGRMPYIKQLTDFLQQENFEISVKLFCDNEKTREKYKDIEVDFINKPLSYRDMVMHVQQYEALLDFENPSIHQGLSFRIFEALFYGKKIITNNPLVLSFDFYHPNNIFVWNKNNLYGIKDFLEIPMVKIDPCIVEKYSFRNWITTVLD
ncbi:hypothetical protein ORI89_09810 [Sphingobacterium sp. UT-1RO-CII-1]|uniref:hypothetical protein n=1 Tax=Sphingobacterium sp. UT-1RO-CII-1 TaxID=2995225 RepID=UPI00227A2878|nr:hypothetical protein [Sphingobacterium sp. UT-1RO-CII-1]MCY4779946.1 hypothetical protein [Sphingobacterium sp. UT-1RO-CII-1]